MQSDMEYAMWWSIIRNIFKLPYNLIYDNKLNSAVCVEFYAS